MPVGVRRLLPGHDVRTVLDMGWDPQLENGDLLRASEESHFALMITADQNTPYQQNMSGRELALLVLGSNIWPIVREYEDCIRTEVSATSPGRYSFIEMRADRQVRPKPPRD